MTVYRLQHKFRTPYSPLISHRCQKEACTEIKGRIWALCSKIKLSVVIFYITFRTAYWKMFPLLGSLPPLLSASFPFPSLSFLLSFLFLFFSLHVSSQIPTPCALHWNGHCNMHSATINHKYLHSDSSRGALVQICLQTEHTTALTFCSREYCTSISAMSQLGLTHPSLPSPQYFSRIKNHNPGTY